MRRLLKPFLCAVLALCFGPDEMRAGMPVDTEFPESFPTIDQLKIVSFDGTETLGEDLLGQAVAVVFLNPSCSKCTVKLPGVDRSFQTFRDEGFTVIAAASTGGGGGLDGLRRQRGYDWLWASNSGEIKRQLNNHSSFEILVFDRTGFPRFRIKENDAEWKLHLELCIGAAIERALDLSGIPQGYVGSAVCGLCHTQEWEQWSQTPHAHSMLTLRKAQQHYKLECVVCHVTGEAGKDTRPWRLTPKELQEVGCEECHGPGGPHRTVPHEYADLHSIEESSCVRCHDEENSPNWDYKEYLAKVVHSYQADESISDLDSASGVDDPEEEPEAASKDDEEKADAVVEEDTDEESEVSSEEEAEGVVEEEDSNDDSSEEGDSEGSEE